MDWLWGLGIIALLLLLVYSSTGSRNLVDIEVSDTELVLTPRGLNKLWTFKRGFSIPISSIRSATVVSGKQDLPTGWRLLGTAIPGLIVQTHDPHTVAERVTSSLRST